MVVSDETSSRSFQFTNRLFGITGSRVKIMRGSNRGSAQPMMAKSPWWLCGNIGDIIQE
ncbi:hypothetical protein [Paenibacillus sp. S02]|uniref:hypothetical protein n=1 Tax=Paenibacillus sp. S02 TaxID=2823904 RepID=UPI001C649833|nr:hypothetical protein [Paenibacillus sp. S02]